MATQTEVRRLTAAYRSAQVQRAALIAALIAAYYRSRVDPEDPVAVNAFLDWAAPRILDGSDGTGRLAAAYATNLRRLELPSAPRERFEPTPGSVAEQVRTSLVVVGPGDYLRKMRKIETLDVSPTQREALLREAKEVTAAKIAASTLRHVQSGGRNTLQEVVRRDQRVLGYARVTRDKPCFFCAMLASRGLVFAEDSFDASDARFTGEGNVKVHDECQCALKPVYTRKDDPVLLDNEKFVDHWERWGAGGGDALTRFRRGYEHWAKTGEYLDWETVNDIELYRAR